MRAPARLRIWHARLSSAPTRSQVTAARPAAAPLGRPPACEHTRASKEIEKQGFLVRYSHAAPEEKKKGSEVKLTVLLTSGG